VSGDDYSSISKKLFEEVSRLHGFNSRLDFLEGALGRLPEIVAVDCLYREFGGGYGGVEERVGGYYWEDFKGYRAENLARSERYFEGVLVVGREVADDLWLTFERKQAASLEEA
jgi:hypothetical protein